MHDILRVGCSQHILNLFLVRETQLTPSVLLGSGDPPFWSLGVWTLLWNICDAFVLGLDLRALLRRNAMHLIRPRIQTVGLQAGLTNSLASKAPQFKRSRFESATSSIGLSRNMQWQVWRWSRSWQSYQSVLVHNKNWSRLLHIHSKSLNVNLG